MDAAPPPPRDVDAVARALDGAADAVTTVLRGNGEWGLADPSRGQYHVDVAADRAALGPLLDAGLGVLSEESGHHHPERPVTVALDPLDGSTNASRGVPWFATSLCAVDADGPLVALVVDQVRGRRFTARRGQGAWRDGEPLVPRDPVPAHEAVVGVADVPPTDHGWAQFRSLGSVALDLCAVASGTLDGYLDCGRPRGAHGPWDYLGGMLVCQEAGAVTADARGEGLVVLDHGARRTPTAATHPALLDHLLGVRRRIDVAGDPGAPV